MTFNSVLFLACLPAVLLASAALHRRVRLQNLFLLAFSLFFYGYWDWRFLALLVATVLVDYAVGLALGAAASPRGRRGWLLASVAVNLGVLGVFKYYDFFAAGLCRLLSLAGLEAHPRLLALVLPVGISFYTFQSLTYTVDVWRGTLRPVRSLVDYALYVTFFPQLVAGPIERAANLLPQIAGPKLPSRSQLREGGFLLLYGLFQKIAVGDAAGSLADFAFDNPGSGGVVLLAGAFAFSLQIYGDFAGYSSIARGCAKMLGVELMVNFRQPYLSASVTEFWHRWHISLSTFLRDYLYIPLGGSRCAPWRGCANLMAVMLLGGLWHGANMTFVAWGGLHGAYLVAHKLMGRGRKAAEGPTNPAARLAGMLGVFVLVSLTWVFFRAGNLHQALEWLAGIASLRPGAWGPGLLIQLAVIGASLLPFEIAARRTGSDTAPLGWPWWLRGLLYAFLLWSVSAGIGVYRAFIYFQF